MVDPFQSVATRYFLAGKYQTGLKRFCMVKHTSLFVQSVSAEEKRFGTLTHVVIVIKLFSFSLTLVQIRPECLSQAAFSAKSDNVELP